ncbi:hypothetical protein D3C84_1038660 [compost metagenome]
MVGAQGEYIERLEVTARIRHLAKEVHLPGNAQLGGQGLELGFQAPLAKNCQAGASRQPR